MNKKPQGSWYDRLESTASCIKHGKDIKTQYIGLTSILLLRKDWNSIRLDRMQSFFKKHFQLIVFRKLLGWKLKKSHTKKYTCHLDFHQRSPWNTSGKENWVQNTLNDQEVGQLSRSFQSNRPIRNPIRERTERPVSRDDARTLQDWRKTSRSQEIDVSSFHEELVSSERTGRLVIETNTENVPDSSQTRSVHESETFNVGDKTLRERTVRPVIDHDKLSHEKNGERGGHGLPNSRATAFCCEACAEYQRSRTDSEKLRTTQIDTIFSKVYDKIKQKNHFVQNQRKWFRTWATSSCLQCSRRNPKRSAQHAYHTGM